MEEWENEHFLLTSGQEWISAWSFPDQTKENEIFLIKKEFSQLQFHYSFLTNVRITPIFASGLSAIGLFRIGSFLPS